MLAIIVYAVVVSILLTIVGSILLLVDHHLENRKIERMTACGQYLIATSCEEAKRLSIETIKEINDNLFKSCEEEA